MRKISFLVLMCVLLVNNSFGSPLIFIVSKDVQPDKLTEIAQIDTTKYKQIRIAVEGGESDSIESSSAYIELIRRRAEASSKLTELRSTLKERHPEVLAKQNELDMLNDTIEDLKKEQINSELFVSISAVENGKEIELLNSEGIRSKRSFLIDTPPTKLKISAKGRGKYTVYIWGQ